MIARLNAGDGSIDDSFGRVVLGDSFAKNYRTTSGFDVADDGDVLLNVQAYTTGQPFEEEQPKILRLQGDGTTPGPVALIDQTITVTGTDDDDKVLAVAGDPADGGATTRVTLNGIGRIYDTADADLVSVTANAGDDLIVLSTTPLPSTVSGGDGADRIAGGLNDDSLSGNAGKDVIAGGGGNDRLAGNGGRDKLAGDDGDDRLFGGSSGDWLAGQNGDDQLFGEGGNDHLVGGPGIDELHGNAGDDTFASIDGAVDQLFGDRGHDTATSDDNDVLHGIETVAPAA
jgi:Ca2+-binding RTX toxin-like protein